MLMRPKRYTLHCIFSDLSALALKANLLSGVERGTYDADTFDLFRLLAKTVVRECIQLNRPIYHNKISRIHPTQVEVLAALCRRRRW